MFAAVRFSIEEDSAALSSHRPPPFHIFGKNASIRLGKHKQPKSKEAQTVSLCWTKTKQKTNYKLKTTTTTLETHQKKLSNTHKAELFKISICNFSIFSLCSQHGLCVCVFFSSHFDFLFGSQLMRTFSVFLLVVQLTFSFLSLSQKTHFVCGANAFLFFHSAVFCLLFSPAIFLSFFTTSSWALFFFTLALATHSVTLSSLSLSSFFTQFFFFFVLSVHLSFRVLLSHILEHSPKCVLWMYANTWGVVCLLSVSVGVCICQSVGIHSSTSV